MKVLIVTGGNSSERKISFLSAKNVKGALEKKKHKIKLFDLRKGFKVLGSEIEKYDVIFPILHGTEGEDGSLYIFLIKYGKPFVGCSPKSTKIASDKILSNKFCDKYKIPRPRWKIIKNLKDIKRFGFPCVLKAAKGGSSLEVMILKSERDLNKKLAKKILNLNNSFLVETYIPGTEVTVGVFNNKALPVIEIVPPEGEWFDYKNKYSGRTQEIINAPSLDEKTKKLTQKIALKIHKTMQLGPYSRTDFMILGNNPIVLEVNPPCAVGLTLESLVPKAAKATGINFPEFCETLIKTAK